VPSAVHQYTEQPPGGPGGSLRVGGAIGFSQHRQGSGGGSGATASNPSNASSPSFPASSGSAGTGRQTGEGEAGTKTIDPSGPTGARADRLEEQPTAAGELSASGYPTTPLIWIALALLALAMLCRIALGIGTRAGDRSAD
jgi:hypothetical protein